MQKKLLDYFEQNNMLKIDWGKHKEELIEFIEKVFDFYKYNLDSYKEREHHQEKNIKKFVKLECSFLFEKGIKQEEMINILKIVKPIFENLYEREKTKNYSCIFFNQLIEKIYENYNIFKKNGNLCYDLLLQNGQDGIIILEAVNEGKDFVIKDLNRVAEYLFDIRKEYLVDRRLSKSIFKGDKDYLNNNIFRVWQSGKSKSFIYKNYIRGKLISYTKYYAYAVQTGEIILIIDNMTNFKKKEERLRKSEEKYRALFHYANDMIFLNDAKGGLNSNFLEVNETACWKLQYEREELLALTPEEVSFLRGDYYERKGILDVFRRKGSITYECSLRKNNGEKMPVEINSHLFRFMGRESIISVARDITQRKKNEKELKEKEERYRKLIELSPAGIIVVSKNGSITFINQAAVDMFGEESTEKSIGEQFFKYIHSDFKLQAKKKIEKALVSKKTNPLQLYKYLCKNGDVFFSETQSTYLKYGGEDAVLVVFSDISERLEGQRKLKESKERYKKLVELSPDYIIVHRKSKIVFANENTLKKFENILGKNIMELMHPLYRERARMRIKDVLNNGNTYNMIETKYLDLDGNEVDIEESVSPFCFMGENAILIVAHDITKRKKTEAELELIRKNLQENEKLALIGQISAGMAHEIRNPLTAVRGFTQLIKKKYVEDLELQSYVNLIIDEIDQINEVISDFLQLARPREPMLKEYSVDQVIREAIAIVLPHALLHNISISFKPNIEMIYCSLDKSQIKQVLLNMFNNSIEAIKEKGVIEVSSVFVPKAREIIIKISDNGCGIPPERQEKLGMPFYSTKETGTGLGLSVSYSIIKAHKGRVEVKSEVGIGTTFCIHLPCLAEFF